MESEPVSLIAFTVQLTTPVLPCHVLLQLTVRDALTSALDEEMARDPAVYILGEEVG